MGSHSALSYSRSGAATAAWRSRLRGRKRFRLQDENIASARKAEAQRHVVAGGIGHISLRTKEGEGVGIEPPPSSIATSDRRAPRRVSVRRAGPVERAGKPAAPHSSAAGVVAGVRAWCGAEGGAGGSAMGTGGAGIPVWRQWAVPSSPPQPRPSRSEGAPDSRFARTACPRPLSVDRGYMRTQAPNWLIRRDGRCLLFASLGPPSAIDFAFTGGGGAVNEQGSAIGSEDRGPPPVFISYATADRTEALKVCKAIERRGTQCWISMRDVPPGANYQEAIVQSLRTARAVVLVFSDAANTSDEIKKELSLASRYHVPVIALRLKDVEPSDAFAYELSTRQWINAFEGWDKSIDTLVGRIAQISGSGPVAPAAATPASRRTAFSSRRGMAIAAAGLLSLVAAAGAWWALRPPQAAAHSMTVRLAGFQLLSADLPATLRDTVDAEITAAFNVDGVVGVSTAPAPAPGAAPAYTLGGTIQRDGDTIRVITRMVNERSGATLWSDTFNYDGNEVSRVPRHIAVDAGNVVRCGLFGASTYHKPLPDAVLRDYMQFCQGHWDPNLLEGRKALIPAQRVVAAVPDFSWGWAAVAGAYWKVAMSADNSRIAEEARASGREAADRAVAIDSRNSEALYIKVHAARSARLDRSGRPVETRRRGPSAGLRMRVPSIRVRCWSMSVGLPKRSNNCTRPTTCWPSMSIRL